MADDPNDAPTYLGRWEPFILGCLTNVVHDEAAQSIDLHILHRATVPDVQNPFVIVYTQASVDGRVKQFYRITVERIEPPPEDDEA